MLSVGNTDERTFIIHLHGPSGLFVSGQCVPGGWGGGGGFEIKAGEGVGGRGRRRH